MPKKSQCFTKTAVCFDLQLEIICNRTNEKKLVLPTFRKKNKTFQNDKAMSIGRDEEVGVIEVLLSKKKEEQGGI